MKVYVIKSDHSEVPLAEVREAGGIIDWVVDNTNGKLPAKIGRSMDALSKFVTGSSHLTIEEPKKATVNLLRYVMDNGDVVEITSDGHTVLLNGVLLGEEEKNALFAAVKRKEINVTRKTDVQQAIPVMPTAPPAETKPVKVKLDPAILDMIKNDQQKEQEAKDMSDRANDLELEEKEFHGAEDKEWTRRLAYWLRYGDQ